MEHQIDVDCRDDDCYCCCCTGECAIEPGATQDAFEELLSAGMVEGDYAWVG